MMRTTCALRTIARQILHLAVFGTAMVVAQPATAEDAVSVLLKRQLADMTGKEGTLITVDYAPGAESESHVHPGSVFAYVLEGAVVSQLEGEKAVTYTKGQSWYESPKQPHVVSKNASKTEPAKLLVFLLSQEGESLKKPMNSSDSGR